MASGVSTTQPFSIGAIQDLINNYKLMQGADGTPIKGLISCLPNNNYSNYDFLNLKQKVESLEVISRGFESNRTNIILNDFILQLKYIECLGQDSTYLFENYNQMKSFVEYIENKINDRLIVYKMDVTQNPNYYNR
jgi:hypothetical protein